MPAQRRTRSTRSLTFIGSLLLTTALAAPAFAQVEEVIVTAQKKSEDIQSVPISMSAFGGNDLAAHQIAEFKDLQFAVPSVQFTKGNFGPSNFLIRGIGSSAVANSGDPGIAVLANDIYLPAPPLTSGTYFDVEQVAVLRGPQSTLYGRNATGGAINVISNKPNLDEFAADTEGTYGNYNYQELRGMLNVPIVEGELGVRLAGYWEKRDGTIDNIYGSLHPGSGIKDKLDGRNDYSIRGSIRWQPSDATTVDVVIAKSAEDDSRARAIETRCHTDPSGVLGCLPDRLAAEAANPNAGLSRVAVSDIGGLGIGNDYQAIFTPAKFFAIGTPFMLYRVSQADPYGTGVLGPVDIQTTDPVGQQIPNSLRKVNNDFNPFTRGHDTFASFTWKQNWADWLDMTLLAGFDKQDGLSQQAYTTSPGGDYNAFAPTCVQRLAVTGNVNPALCPLITTYGPALPFTRVASAQAVFGALYPTSYNAYFNGHVGELPISGIGNNGAVGLNIAKYTDHDSAFDQISGKSRMWNAEWRFQSNFKGPFNFLLAAYHIDYRSYDVQYFVNNSGAFDYLGIVFGPLLSGLDGTILSPTQFNSESKDYHLKSNSAFGEIYYDIADNLKFTAGARYTMDDKFYKSRSIALNAIQAVGTTTPPAVNPACLTLGAVCDANAYLLQNQSYNAWTGRAVLNWTPELDFTDKTMAYASYSRGFRSGGFNPPPTVPGQFPNTFDPEKVDSFEVGAKNTILGGLMQANVDAWYYDYQGYQVSSIINRQSVNQNVNTKLWGVEGELFYAPDDNWQFNMNFGFTHSRITGSDLPLYDTRSPVQGAAGYTLVKDSNGANCAVFNTTGGAAPTASTPGFKNWLAEPEAQVDPSVAEHVAYLRYPLTCGSLSTAGGLQPAIYNAVYATAIAGGALPGVAAATATAAANAVAGYDASIGVAANVKGNEMPLTPKWTIGVGGQYTWHMDGDYNTVFRMDYYWKDKSYGRIFNDGADRLKSWDVVNASIQLNAPENAWYAKAWVQNLMDKDNVTGMYVTDPASALFTNLFVGDPRTYGLTVGAHF